MTSIADKKTELRVTVSSYPDSDFQFYFYGAVFCAIASYCIYCNLRSVPAPVLTFFTFFTFGFGMEFVSVAMKKFSSSELLIDSDTLVAKRTFCCCTTWRKTVKRCDMHPMIGVYQSLTTTPAANHAGRIYFIFTICVALLDGTGVSLLNEAYPYLRFLTKEDAEWLQAEIAAVLGVEIAREMVFCRLLSDWAEAARERNGGALPDLRN
uniref:Uncharacterized protein n=1 Tax=Grammatophora oceanica TaxID=210454 RepID=A0A7S1VMK8_9STRA|mmetsp:Transcript_49143/g.73285  ORF Transcript_49143/g.73285 Transcript_49143/m.73285 type:complete len:209 (+) Transcript_49143:291-917(+)